MLFRYHVLCHHRAAVAASAAHFRRLSAPNITAWPTHKAVMPVAGSGRDSRRREYNTVADLRGEIWAVESGESRQRKDRRLKNEQENEKRAAADGDATRDDLAQGESTAKSSIFPIFSQEEVAAEERRPKHKVAVMIGYSGSGYRGMQINTTEKTIEGDLFSAFVAAGAISKANANDPKKSSLSRCARTDKGVHAAGNVISLKLIVENEDVVQKINEHLPEQVRVWGIQRTVGSFNCYQACDSRWYEYLIPSHSFLPPHPSSWLAKQLSNLSKEAEDSEGYSDRQAEVASFWNEVEDEHIKPILDTIDHDIKASVLSALYDADGDQAAPIDYESNSGFAEVPDDSKQGNAEELVTGEEPATNDAAEISKRQRVHEKRKKVDAAAKSLRAAYVRAKREYRIPKARLDRVGEVLTYFVGTRNFHNYTVGKAFGDPSAKRHIKSFSLNRDPIIINGTEWLSLKVHGQSFMMHQIRKMVGMIALVVRCGCPLSRVPETFQESTFSIPKVPGLGLLLERPVFDSYNEGAATKFQRERIDFSRFNRELEEFKQREIYERIFREEETGNAFHAFFSHIDNFQEPFFLYLSSLGINAVKRAFDKESSNVAAPVAGARVDSDDEALPDAKGEEDS